MTIICYDCLEYKEVAATVKGRTKCKECMLIRNKDRPSKIGITTSVLDRANKETIAANKKL